MSYRVRFCNTGYLCTHHGVDRVDFATRLHALLAIQRYRIKYSSEEAMMIQSPIRYKIVKT